MNPTESNAFASGSVVNGWSLWLTACGGDNESTAAKLEEQVMRPHQHPEPLPQEEKDTSAELLSSEDSGTSLSSTHANRPDGYPTGTPSPSIGSESQPHPGRRLRLLLLSGSSAAAGLDGDGRKRNPRDDPSNSPSNHHNPYSNNHSNRHGRSLKPTRLHLQELGVLPRALFGLPPDPQTPGEVFPWTGSQGHSLVEGGGDFDREENDWSKGCFSLEIRMRCGPGVDGQDHLNDRVGALDGFQEMRASLAWLEKGPGEFNSSFLCLCVYFSLVFSFSACFPLVDVAFQEVSVSNLDKCLSRVIQVDNQLSVVSASEIPQVGFTSRSAIGLEMRLISHTTRQTRLSDPDTRPSDVAQKQHDAEMSAS